MLQTVGESPMASQTPPEIHQDIMHSMLSSGGIALMASDMGKGQFVHRQFNFSHDQCGTEEINTSHDWQRVVLLSSRWPSKFWGSIYGELTDRFLTWTMNYDKPQA